VGDYDDLVRWTLWSRGLGVVSHDTAISIHDLGDVNPRRVHLTLPPGFRAKADGVVLHHGELGEGDTWAREGYRITTPFRTAIDAAASGVRENPCSSRGAQPGMWVVKGGMAVELRRGYAARMTKDLDLNLRWAPEEGNEAHKHLVARARPNPGQPRMASIASRQTASGETRWDVRYAAQTRGTAPGPSTGRQTRSDSPAWSRPTSLAASGSTPSSARTFGDWAARWVPTIAGLTPKTREGYESILRRHLLPRFAETPVNRIDHPTVVGLLAELTAAGAGAGTVRNVRDVLRLVL